MAQTQTNPTGARRGIFKPGVDIRGVGITAALSAVLDWIISDVRFWAILVAVAGLIRVVATTMVSDPLVQLQEYTELLATGDATAALASLADTIETWLLATSVVVPVLAVIGWFFTARALGAIRGEGRSAGEVVVAGILSVVVGIIVGIVFVLAFVAALIVGGVLGGLAGGNAGGGLFFIVMIAFFIVAAYFAFRLMFVSVALFDRIGFGAVFGHSWQTTKGAVLSVLGWSIVGGLVGLVLGFLIGAVGGILTEINPMVAAFFSGAAEAVVLLFDSTWIVVIYARLRARREGAAAATPAATVGA